MKTTRPDPRDEAHLSPRQEQIAGLICQGLYNGEIAARLRVSNSTVRRHIEALFRRLSATNRIGIAVAFTRRTLAKRPMAETPALQRPQHRRD